MGPRRVVMVAMPCREVVEVGGVLDVLYAANQNLVQAGAADPGYAAEVESPVVTVRAWPGLRLVADRSFRSAASWTGRGRPHTGRTATSWPRATRA